MDAKLCNSDPAVVGEYGAILSGPKRLYPVVFDADYKVLKVLPGGPSPSGPSPVIAPLGTLGWGVVLKGRP